MSTADAGTLLFQFATWYAVVQLLALSALPLTMRIMARLPDRGYASAKIMGVVLVSVVLWLGYSYGFMRHDAGSAWLSVGVLAVVSAVAGRDVIREMRRTRRFAVSWRYVFLVEALFLAGFGLWALVRAYDPAVNHTEQPMDMMFMNSIWSSPDYPPQDAWLGGYAVSYYYLGYWLLTVLARLAGQTPEVAYNIGQANWYGFLLIGSFGLVYNLLAFAQQDEHAPPETAIAATAVDPVRKPTLGAVLGGLLAAVWVAVAGNLQIVLEWLYAHGMNAPGLWRWVNVRSFPENAAVTNQWFIDYGWWWWRSSRVIRDFDLAGNHIEVIDEFPAFSYVLGDNHPHVMAMPVVLLVLGLALAHFLPSRRRDETASAGAAQDGEPDRPRVAGGVIGGIVTVVATGALIFLNTWDFPPYWLLLVAVALFVGMRHAVAEDRAAGAVWRAGLGTAVAVGVTVVVGTLLVYLPYFLTAQSQAGGLLPNLFNPTRLPQFLLMFGAALPALVALILVAWTQLRPAPGKVFVTLLLVYALPAAFLAMTAWLGVNTTAGRAAMSRMTLPPGASSHLPFILERWTAAPWTFLLTGGLLALVLVLIWETAARFARGTPLRNPPALFALLLAGIGLLLAFAPEWIYLRDNFGTRMNTVFKFYYQAWLLFALAGSYAVVTAFRRLGRRSPVAWSAAALASLSLVLVAASLVFTPAGAYSKTNGFRGVPTFDGVAYIRAQSPPEWRAAMWVRDNVAPDALVLEGKGASYRAETNRMSTLTGRPTLLGWDGHESQWRGRAYGRMAAGRVETLDLIYRSGGPQQIEAALAQWDIDYIYVGPTERNQYDITPATEARLAQALDLVFEDGDVRIYRRRGAPATGAIMDHR